MVRRGAVILEAVLALALLAVVLGVVAQASRSQDLLAIDARREVAARSALLAEVERLRSARFDEVASSKARPLPDRADLPHGAIAVEVASEGNDLKRVSVTVSWTPARGGASRTRTLSTLRARAGGPR